APQTPESGRACRAIQGDGLPPGSIRTHINRMQRPGRRTRVTAMSQPPNRLPAFPANGLAGGGQDPNPHREAIPAPAVALMPLLLSLAQAAVLLGVSTRTVKRLAAGDELPEGAVTHIGRRRLLNRLILERWVAQGCPPPAGRRRKPR